MSTMNDRGANAILETKRLLLRRFTMDDLDEIYSLAYADPRVKHLWSGATGTPEAIKERFAARWILPEDDLRFRAVVLKERNTLIGLMGFQRHEPGEGRDIYYLHSENEPNRRVGFDPNFIEIELTYALGYAYWKQGYATEMGRAIVAYGFDRLGIGRIIQGVLTNNVNSVNLMRRLGFRIERGTRPNQTVGILERDRYEKVYQTEKEQTAKQEAPAEAPTGQNATTSPASTCQAW